jgi:hypothetical protein
MEGFDISGAEHSAPWIFHYCLYPIVYYYTVLLYNHQHNKFVINKQCYYIIILLLCTFATYFDPAELSSRNFREYKLADMYLV